MSEENEPVGSAAEEAVKLFRALQGLAQESGGEAVAASAASAFQAANGHIARGGKDCKYCPVCHVISAAREVSPEVRLHLGAAAASLLQAAAIWARPENHGRTSQRSAESPVEKIDLDDGGWHAE